jgi:hypothetical protein
MKEEKGLMRPAQERRAGGALVLKRVAHRWAAASTPRPFLASPWWPPPPPRRPAKNPLFF